MNMVVVIPQSMSLSDFLSFLLFLPFRNRAGRYIPAICSNVRMRTAGQIPEARNPLDVSELRESAD